MKIAAMDKIYVCQKQVAELLHNPYFGEPF